MVLKAGKPKNKVPADSVSDEGPLLTCGKGVSGASFIKALIPVHEGSTLLIQSPPKCPISQYHHIDNEVSTYKFTETQTFSP